MHWTDYGARWYDPQLGRWHSVDPLAEEFESWSPYNYVMNDPIKLVDPDGRGPVKGLKALYNVGKRTYKTYKKTGKLNAKSIGNAAKDEILSIVDNVSTIVDSESSIGDKVFAAFDLVTGFGGEAKSLSAGLGITAKEVAEGAAKSRKGGKKVPTMTAAAVDKKTDEVSIDFSGKPHPKNINPELETNMKNLPEGGLEYWDICNCAEFKAVNKALNKGSKMEDLEVHTVRTKTGQAASRCKNCKVTTRGANVTSDK